VLLATTSPAATRKRIFIFKLRRQSCTNNLLVVNCLTAPDQPLGAISAYAAFGVSR
jgi:hypothetical protein